MSSLSALTVSFYKKQWAHLLLFYNISSASLSKHFCSKLNLYFSCASFCISSINIIASGYMEWVCGGQLHSITMLFIKRCVLCQGQKELLELTFIGCNCTKLYIMTFSMSDITFCGSTVSKHLKKIPGLHCPSVLDHSRPVGWVSDLPCTKLVQTLS